MMTSSPLPIPDPARGGILAIGNFDGVHRGHQAMMDRLKAQAQSVGGPAVVMTFDPHPWVLLRPDKVPAPLTTIEHRVELLKVYGADHVIVYPTDRRFLELSAYEFFQQVVVATCGARGLVEGPNFFFGRNREGNVTRLKSLCDAAGLSLDIIPPITLNDQLVSSSVIRSLITDGSIDAAVGLLGHPYRLTGTVVAGAKRGRTLGFPTANLDQYATLVPGIGVYAGRSIVDGISYPAAIHIGPNSTFGESAVKVEVHLLDFSGDLYGRELSVDLLSRLRDVGPFPSKDALVEQLNRDCARARELVASIPSSIHEAS